MAMATMYLHPLGSFPVICSKGPAAPELAAAAAKILGDGCKRQMVNQGQQGGDPAGAVGSLVNTSMRRRPSLCAGVSSHLWALETSLQQQGMPLCSGLQVLLGQERMAMESYRDQSGLGSALHCVPAVPARGFQVEAASSSGRSGGLALMSRADGQLMRDDMAGLPTLDGVQDEAGFRGLPLEPLPTECENLLAHYVPIYVMLPLDTVKKGSVLSHPELLACNLKALRAAGVDGVMVDVWWGIVEAKGPKEYDWSAYRALFQHIQAVGLKVQVVMSFHQCGGNVGDGCYIPLPAWVLACGEACPDIFFTNKNYQRNQEYLSFGIDEEPVLAGRTGVQVYYDFMKSFRDNMAEFLQAGMITEIEVGLGPAGELRYPSYPETHGWRFPGIGEFQCYDKFLLAQLSHAANQIGQQNWGLWGPHNAGSYNDWPQQTGFFGDHCGFSSDYGRFFLEWYSNVLLTHGNRVLEAASDVFAGFRTKLAAKVAGIHWWYNSKNHAAELAAGYYNLRERDGYRPIAKMLARHYATLNFTCIEMRNDEQYFDARCGPEGLVHQVLNAGWEEGIEVSCENALPRYDEAAFDQIFANAFPDGIHPGGPPKRRISSFTFLRLCPELLAEHNWSAFVRFVRRMHAGLDYHEEPEAYFRPRTLLRRSKPPQAMTPDAPRTNVASVPINVDDLPLAPARQQEPFFSPDAPGGGLGVQVGEIQPSAARGPFGVGAGPPAAGMASLAADVAADVKESEERYPGAEERGAAEQAVVPEAAAAAPPPFSTQTLPPPPLRPLETPLPPPQPELAARERLGFGFGARVIDALLRAGGPWGHLEGGEGAAAAPATATATDGAACDRDVASSGGGEHSIEGAAAVAGLAGGADSAPDAVPEARGLEGVAALEAHGGGGQAQEAGTAPGAGPSPQGRPVGGGGSPPSHTGPWVERRLAERLGQWAAAFASLVQYRQQR